LTASIATRDQPASVGIVTNASTCLRMLAADPPNVDGARETARRTISRWHRASDVDTRFRAHIRKATMRIANRTARSFARRPSTLEDLAASIRKQVLALVTMPDRGLV